MADTQLTTINLTTSFARYFAEKLTEAGWAIYWQATDVSSGTATLGDVTLVSEFPDDPSLLVLPPKSRIASEVLLPAFSTAMFVEPFERERAGLGDSEFLYGATFGVDGFVVDQSQHMAFAAMMRNWFKRDTRLLVYDYESEAVNPDLIDIEVLIDRRTVERLRSVDPNIPRQARYYLTMQVDVLFYE